MSVVSEVRSYGVLIPASTPVAAPLVTPITMPARIVTEIRVRVPPGPNGSVGFRLGAAGQQIIPWNEGSWIITDNETVPWQTLGQIESGAWELTAYNVGRWDHTLYVQFVLLALGAELANAPLRPLMLAP